MANWFVDSQLGSGNNDGTTTDHAWRGASAIKTAMESAGFTAGDRVWVKRDSIYDEGVAGNNADIAIADDGTASAPIYFIGCPRAAIPNTTITQADWTNGSRKVDNVVGITPSRTAHTGRFATAPDGKKYLIVAVLWEAGVDGMAAGDEFTVNSTLTNTTQTKKGKLFGFTDDLDTTGTIQYVRDCSTAWVENDNITDNGAAGGSAEIDSGGETAVGFIIDREYAGSTVTGTNGKFEIDEDEDYDTFHAIDDAAWTIKISTWEDDAHDLPIIDFNNENYDLVSSGDDYISIRNFEIKDSADSNTGCVYLNSIGGELRGCLVKQPNNYNCVAAKDNKISIVRTIMEGTGTGNANRGCYLTSGGGMLLLKDCSIFNCGDNAIYGLIASIIELENVNLGTEIPDGDNEIASVYGSSIIKGMDVSFGGAAGYFGPGASSHGSVVSIENFGKVLGKHKTYYGGGTWESEAVTSTNANKKLSDTILKITPSVNLYGVTPTSYDEMREVVYDAEFQLASGAQTIKFWLYNDTGATLNDSTAKDNIYLRATYVDSYDDTTEYTQTIAYSTEIDILDAADADDWDFLTVSVNPDTASKVRVELLLSLYDATGDILIDPQPVIT